MASAHIKTVRTKNGARYVVRYRPGGRSSPTRHAGSFRTKAEAEARLRYVRGELAAMREPVLRQAQDTGGSVAAAFDRHLDRSVDLSLASVKVYRQAQSQLGGLGRRVVAGVTADDVQDWVRRMMDGGLAPSTIRTYVSKLRTVLDGAGLEPNPARSVRVKMPSIEREEVQPPSGLELEAMLLELRKTVSNSRTRRYPLVCELIDGSGLRVGEIKALTWGDVDFAGGRLRIARQRTKGKTQGRRFVPVSGRLLASIAELAPLAERTSDGPVFPGLSDDGLRNAMARACVAAGVPDFSPHDVRHRWISRLVLAGVPISRVRALAGHSKASVTLDVYSHVLMDEPAHELAELREVIG